MGVDALDLTDQVDAAHHVAPLVVATGLERAAVAAVKLEEVVGLQDLVGELGVGDTLVRGNTPRDDILVEHGAHAEVLADRAQKVDGAHLLGPVQVVHHRRGGRSLEVEELRDLRMQAIRPALHNVSRLELALAALARVADLPGCAAHERERTVASELQVTHDDQLNEVSMVQRGCRRVIAAIEGDRSGVQVLAERLEVGVLREQPTPLQFVQNVCHESCPSLRIRRVNTVLVYRLASAGVSAAPLQPTRARR